MAHPHNLALRFDDAHTLPKEFERARGAIGEDTIFLSDDEVVQREQQRRIELMRTAQFVGELGSERWRGVRGRAEIIPR